MSAAPGFRKKLVKSCLSIALCVILAGCASSIMNGYMGKSLQEAMLDYGPPSNAFDMPDGSRAFQWVMNSSGSTATMASTTGTVADRGSPGAWSSNTQIGGYTI